MLDAENDEYKQETGQWSKMYHDVLHENEKLKSRKLTMSRYIELDNQVTRGEITFSRFIELINEEFEI